jgi:hypothetical protein
MTHRVPPAKSRLSENETIMPASKARRLKEEHFGGFYLGVFETLGKPNVFGQSGARGNDNLFLVFSQSL